MFMPRSRRKTGFSLVETIIALAVLVMLMAAVGVAVHGSAMNCRANENIFKAISTARRAVMRITGDLRTATAVSDADPPSQCSMITSDGRDITYRFSSTDGTLYLDDNAAGTSYVLCRNVSAMTFTRTTVPGSNPVKIKNVRISMTVTVGGVSQTVASAAVIRRNM